MLKTIKNISTIALETVRLKKSDSEFLDKKSANVIINLLGQEKGIALKIAQMLGSSEESLEEFQKLTSGSNLEAMPLSEIGPIIQERMQGKVDDHYEQVEEAKWVASLGQVHKCRLKNYPGDYALKVLYPNIKDKIQQQLKLIGLFGKLGSKTKLKKWGFDIGDYLSNFSEAMDKETDYTHELKNIKQFHHYNKGRDIFYPEAIEELSSSDLLVTKFMRGNSIETFLQVADMKSRKQFAENFLTSYLHQLLSDGYIQGDTHRGNFYVFQNKTVFLDFGHFLELTEKEVNAFRVLLKSIISKEDVNLLNVLSDLGFDSNKLEVISDKLPLFLSALFKPFLVNQPFQLNQWSPKEEVDTILGEDKWWIRSSGNARFFQVLRSFWGMHLILKQVGTPLNWFQCASEVLAPLNISITPEMADQSRASSAKSLTSLSEHLKVQVFRDNKKTVDLTFPSRATLTIEDLIDNETIKKLKSRGINIIDIKNEALKNNLKPDVLFELDDEGKRFKVFLV